MLLFTLCKMLTMNADKWIFILALCFMCVSSNDEQVAEECCEEDFCETLRAPLGSSVLLPCNFAISEHSWVKWVHISKLDLILLSSEGRITFLDPRHGRIQAFPNQSPEGNFSISIDQLKNSDLGCYACKQGAQSLQVKLVAEISTLSNEWLLIYICVGVAALFLLSVGGYYYCCMKCILPCTNKTQEYPVSAGTEGASAPPVAMSPGPVHGLQIGVDNVVYENDDRYLASDDPTRNHCGPPGALQDADSTRPSQSTGSIYPNLNQFNFERVESQRTKRRFHTELISRLRQASLTQHYYVNQGEIRKHEGTSRQEESHPRAGLGKKKDKKNREYKNPIYNRSTDQLNQL